VKQCKHGKFLLNKHDTDISKVLAETGEWEEHSLELFLNIVREGDTVIDAGANVGAITIPLAKRVGPRGRVHAFEPQRIVNQQLNGNVALNSLMNVDVYLAALGNETGSVMVPNVEYRVDANFGALSLSRRFKDASEAWMYPVPVLTLDSLSFAKCPSLLKMDVELMELQVLRGGRKMLADCWPVIYAENNCIHTSPALVEELYALGYVPYWDTNSPMNMVCMPRHKIHTIRPDGSTAEGNDSSDGNVVMIGYTQVLRDKPYLHDYFLEEVQEIAFDQHGVGRSVRTLYPRFTQLGNFTHCPSVIPLAAD
jgi:FkbM family methyltransferase